MYWTDQICIVPHVVESACSSFNSFRRRDQSQSPRYIHARCHLFDARWFDFSIGYTTRDIHIALHFIIGVICSISSAKEEVQSGATWSRYSRRQPRINDCTACANTGCSYGPSLQHKQWGGGSTSSAESPALTIRSIPSGRIGQLTGTIALSESSLSSLSRSTTPFSSEDQLIFSSSFSSAALSFSPPLINHDPGRPSNYSDLIYLNRPWPDETFAFLLPMASSRLPQDLLLNEFHQKITLHPCHQLRSVIDDVVQQQGIRIHRRSQSVLIGHDELECIDLKTLNKSDTPSLIFDDEHKLVHVTKYARWNELQPLISFNDHLSDRFSTCDDCSTILSCSNLSQRLHLFLLVNATHHLVEKCLQAAHQKCTFGFISQKQSNQIEETTIDTSKLTYSYDLDVEHRSFYFVLRVRSWPEEMRSTYERRSRLWPWDTAKLFDRTCFIRIRDDAPDIPRKSVCPSCEQLLCSRSKSSWSYSYATIEAQPISQMSNEHRRFASIALNYINGKSQGKFPFVLFKHVLFYFFEQCSFDEFTTSDVLSPLQLFTEFLFDRLQTPSLAHYFNPDEHLSTERISLELLSMKTNPTDVNQCSMRCLSPSSAYLYHTFYLIQFQFNLFESLLSSKSNTMQTLLDLDTAVIRQLSLGVQAYKQQLDASITIKSHRSVTLDRLYRYQENNIQFILDYLPMLREKEPSLLIHSLWSMFIQYFNSFYDDLFFSEKNEHKLSRIHPLNKISFWWSGELLLVFLLAIVGKRIVIVVTPFSEGRLMRRFIALFNHVWNIRNNWPI